MSTNTRMVVERNVSRDSYGQTVQDKVYAYARIKLSTSGTRTVEFSTTHNTKAQKYTIRVEETTMEPA